MNIYRPYVYMIQHKHNGLFYIGSKYGRTSSTTPDTFWKDYFTSSKTVHKLLQEGSSDDWDTYILFEGTTPSEVLSIEYHLIQLFIQHEKCVNVKLPLSNDDPRDTSKVRRIPDAQGITSYQKGAIKGVSTKRQKIVDGMDGFARAYHKALENNPHLTDIRTRNRYMSMARIDPDTGLNVWQNTGLKIRGDMNPTKRPEVAEKISAARKRYIDENRDVWNDRQQYLNTVTLKARDSEGLNAHDRHSLWMLENNPATGSKWYNNGNHSIRVKDQDAVPKGYTLGRLKTVRASSAYYNDGKRNIRVTEGQEVPNGFVKGKL